MRLLVTTIFLIVCCSSSGCIPKSYVETTRALPKNLFGSLEKPCRNYEKFSFTILDPVDPPGFWELFPELPRIMADKGVDALVIPFTRPKATDLVLFQSLDTMNQILCRPTTYSMETEKLRNHLSIARPGKAYEGFLGHDFEERLLRKFAVKFSEAESEFAIPELAFDTMKLCREREFWKEYLIPRIERNDNLILVSGSLEDEVVEGTVSHELLHAAFYSDKRIRRFVAGFWRKKVTQADKRHIIAALEGEGYEVKKNTKMLHNEFLAYLLERTASKELLKTWVPAYAAKLRKHLTDNAIEIP